MTKKYAIVLMNLGGPDSLESVKPFLLNLFMDKAIIRLPFIFRWMLAHYIAFKRTGEATHIYQQLGGKSPILDETQRQAASLEHVLNQSSPSDVSYRVFIAMRYWHPLTEESVKDVSDYVPDEIVLLPLYPQFSTTTTLSSFQAWDQNAKNYQLPAARKIESYPQHPLFIKAHSDLLYNACQKASLNGQGSVVVLFSAHGLPQSIVNKGDPYPEQIKQTCSAVIEALDIKSIDWKICYQSKVGKLPWLTPSTDTEILKAAQAGKTIVVVPVSFVSEHSETLVELDIMYKELALTKGAKDYIRVPALGTHPLFIDALKQLILSCLRPDNGI